MPCSQFVIETAKKIHCDDRKLHSDVCLNYAKFLQRPLTLPDLVPCVNGVPVEEPHCFNNYEEQYNSVDRDSTCEAWYNDCKAFEKAKANCLFEGFEYDFNALVNQVKNKEARATFDKKMIEQGKVTIEYLAQHFKLKLTSKSIELIYGR